MDGTPAKIADSLGRAAPSWSLQGDLFLRRPLHLPGGTHGVPGMVGSLSALRADGRGEPSGLSLSPGQFSRGRRISYKSAGAQRRVLQDVQGWTLLTVG